MGGHVNMMDDVLISNLPPEILRSALRTLVSQGSVTQQPFVKHIRQRLTESPLEFTPAKVLFPSDDVRSAECERYTSLARCVFSCKLTEEAFPYLSHFVDSLVDAGVKWTASSDLEAVLELVGGDIVQAVQALKESKPGPTTHLREIITSLMQSLERFKTYCKESAIEYPFTRPERQVRDFMELQFGESAPVGGVPDEGVSVLSVSIPETKAVEQINLGHHTVPRLFNGFWQLSSPAWGSSTASKQEDALVELVQSGLTAADMADHYGDAELVYGGFRNKTPPAARTQIYAATKWCIFSPLGHSVTNEWVLNAVKERSRRLGGRVELLQFHWYDYEAKEYLQVLKELVAITKSHPELVSSIGLCNFDSEHVIEACEYLLAETGEVGLVSNQIQFSLLDSRPLRKMCSVSDKYGIKLLTYGSFCGGFLSTKWLGQPAPEIYSNDNQLTPSQRKYFDMINNWGSWADFQSLLEVLSTIAKQHDVTPTNIATRWVLQQTAVGAVIVGTRLGVTSHGNENLSVFKFALDDVELEKINQIALGSNDSRSAELFEKLGDCGNEYRAMH